MPPLPGQDWGTDNNTLVSSNSWSSEEFEARQFQDKQIHDTYLCVLQVRQSSMLHVRKFLRFNIQSRTQEHTSKNNQSIKSIIMNKSFLLCFFKFQYVQTYVSDLPASMLINACPTLVKNLEARPHTSLCLRYNWSWHIYHLIHAIIMYFKVFG